MQIPTNIYGLELLRWVCQTPELTTDDVVIREAIKHLCFPFKLFILNFISTLISCIAYYIMIFELNTFQQYRVMHLIYGFHHKHRKQILE